MVKMLEGNETIAYMRDLENERDRLKELLKDSAIQLNNIKVGGVMCCSVFGVLIFLFMFVLDCQFVPRETV